MDGTGNPCTEINLCVRRGAVNTTRTFLIALEADPSLRLEIGRVR